MLTDTLRDIAGLAQDDSTDVAELRWSLQQILDKALAALEEVNTNTSKQAGEDRVKHTTEIEDGGDCLYYVIRREGTEIGRSYAGGWDDDFGDQDWDEHEISEAQARDRMGNDHYDWAIEHDDSVRYDMPLPGNKKN